jgi:predicted regulator of Ras-like GTPase activity (Roadblock/LC7/MglB family)
MAETTPPALPPVYRCLPAPTFLIHLSDLENAIPPALLLRPSHPGETVSLPAAHVLAHIVPTLSLRLLAKLKSGFVEPSDTVIRVPAARLATGWNLRESAEPFSREAFEIPSRADIPSPSANLKNILVPRPPPQPVGPELPRKLAELITSLPTFRRVCDAPEEPAPTLSPLTLSPVPEDPGQCADSGYLDQNALQALFLTEENLSIPRIVELCGSLPGIHSCVLTHGDRVVSSHNVPAGLDIVSLSANATSMLRAMHEASADMGIGTIPALTLHTAKGPLSIFQNDRLAMLVFHGDRGFIPGVREKMTATLTELSRAPLTLPAPE